MIGGRSKPKRFHGRRFQSTNLDRDKPQHAVVKAERPSNKVEKQGVSGRVQQAHKPRPRRGLTYE